MASIIVETAEIATLFFCKVSLEISFISIATLFGRAECYRNDECVVSINVFIYYFVDFVTIHKLPGSCALSY